jgi:aromatic-L-amino-acid decarboxylase
MSQKDKGNSSNQHYGDMDPNEFKIFGYQLVDWVADYLANPQNYPVLAKTEPDEIKQLLPKEPPQEGESMEQILQDFEKIILPGITHWNHPAFFAYFSISGSAPGILAEFLSAALNVNAMLWKTSPAATELEEVVLNWLRKMLGLPAEFMGIIMDTASVSSLCAIIAAREAQGELKIRQEGMTGRTNIPRLRLYTSEQAHSSIEKGAIVAGIGISGVRKIPVDREYRIIPRALEEAIIEDKNAGWLPFCVCSTIGTTSTTSIDPIPQIAEIAQRHGLWHHVDAAYGGSAAILPEMKYVLDGCDKADSFVMNPHKWLFTPIDFSAFYFRHPDTVRNAFSLVPEYLRTQEDEVVKNFMDYGVSLGRRFRALKLWFIIRYFGKEGLMQRIRYHISLAQKFASWIEDSTNFQLLAPVPFSTLCFRMVPDDLSDSTEDEKVPNYLNTLNEALLQAVNQSGKVFLSHTTLNDIYTIRLAIGNIKTTDKNIEEAWKELNKNGPSLDKKMRANYLK